jgi:hypothetical protein
MTEFKNNTIKIAEFSNVKLIFTKECNIDNECIEYLVDKQSLSKLEFFKILFTTNVGDSKEKDTYTINDTDLQDICIQYFLQVHCYGEEYKVSNMVDLIDLSYHLKILNKWQVNAEHFNKYKKLLENNIKTFFTLSENFVSNYNIIYGIVSQFDNEAKRDFPLYLSDYVYTKIKPLTNRGSGQSNVDNFVKYVKLICFFSTFFGRHLLLLFVMPIYCLQTNNSGHTQNNNQFDPALNHPLLHSNGPIVWLSIETFPST